MRRGLARQPSVTGRRLGIHEHAYPRHHLYVTMVVDLEAQTVLHVADDRTAESLDAYFTALTMEERTAIEAIAMDMWEPFRKAILAHVPDAAGKIVHDRFHVMKHVREAMDHVRRKEQRVLIQRGDRRLTGTKFLWLMARARTWSARQRRAFHALRTSPLKSARAWALKEMIRRLWELRTIPRAPRYFARWYGWHRRSGGILRISSPYSPIP